MQRFWPNSIIRMTRIPKKTWRDAATLIIAGKRIAKDLTASIESIRNDGDCSRPLSGNIGTGNVPGTDFDVLMLKRSSKSLFMPDAFVFPGGVIDSSDSSKEWIKLFESAGHDVAHWRSVHKIHGPRPELFNDYRNIAIGPDLAFRICALRETFEESGVLIVKGKNGEDVADLNPTEVSTWRKKVHENASMFLLMCQQMNFVPDIWSLREWSNWLTPAAMSRRFDTIFYLCCLDYQLHIQHDNKETTHAQWSQPLHMLQDHVAEKLWIAPPQVYEFSRLLRYEKIKNLAEFAKRREPKGCEKWVPVRYACSNGLVGVFPGDDMYPDDPECIEMHAGQSKQASIPCEVSLDKSVKEFHDMAQNLNRIEMISRNHYRVLSNSDRLGHAPINFELNPESLAGLFESKL